MKKEKKLAKAMITLFVDDEYQKLYDKQNDLKLSYNRKKKLLKETLNAIKNIPADNAINCWILVKLKEKIENELDNPYHRHNWGLKCHG